MRAETIYIGARSRTQYTPHRSPRDTFRNTQRHFGYVAASPKGQPHRAARSLVPRLASCYESAGIGRRVCPFSRSTRPDSHAHRTHRRIRLSVSTNSRSFCGSGRISAFPQRQRLSTVALHRLAYAAPVSSIPAPVGLTTQAIPLYAMSPVPSRPAPPLRSTY